jgi:hypothetical protein
MAKTPTVNSAPVPAASRAAEPAGLRRTRATVALTSLFKDHPDWALTPGQVESALAQAGVEVNRVTIYRLLDRFVAAGLLQRHVDDARVAHFSAVGMKAGVWAPAGRRQCPGTGDSPQGAQGAGVAGP